LSVRYFGSEKYWRKVLEINPKLDEDSEKVIPDKTKVIIPNY